MLRGHGLSAPEIFAEDHELGLLLVEDFGDDTYTRLIARGADEAELYMLAIDTLVALQRAAAVPPELPPYDEDRLLGEAALLTDWYAAEILGAPLAPALREEYADLWREALPLAALPGPTLVLRDYHVDNLMLLPGREGVRRCGLLDFQDALSQDNMECALTHVTATHTATGKEVSFSGLCMCRFEDGKITEAWNHYDFLSMHQQLGRVLA